MAANTAEVEASVARIRADIEELAQRNQAFADRKAAGQAVKKEEARKLEEDYYRLAAKNMALLKGKHFFVPSVSRGGTIPAIGDRHVAGIPS